jgi:hypothetical protein
MRTVIQITPVLSLGGAGLLGGLAVELSGKVPSAGHRPGAKDRAQGARSGRLSTSRASIWLDTSLSLWLKEHIGLRQ